VRNLRISPSKIGSYALYLSQDWMTDERFQEGLTGKFEGNEATSLGTALHHMFENCSEQRLSKTPFGINEQGEKVFFSADYLPHLEAYHEIDPIHEMWGRKTIEIGGDSIEINTRCDGIKGLDLFEIKTTKSTISYDSYADSTQWKFYMWIYESEAVTYMVYVPRKSKEGPYMELMNHAYFTIPRPMDFESVVSKDILPLIAGFIGYCENNNLMSYITQEKRNANY